MPLLSVQNLRKYFPIARSSTRVVHAVDDVSFDLHAGEVLALVGESGCGKSTLALSLMNLESPTAGTIFFQNQDITHLKGKALKQLRQNIQMVFQDPYESLNPRRTIRDILTEPLQVHGLAKDKETREKRIRAALESAGLSPTDYLTRRPHELSGGQRQRVVIASALVLEPTLLIADEPVSMLDVSIRAEILKVLETLKTQQGIAMVFITHDLGTAAHFADRIAVMYLGRIVEIGPTREVLDKPQHPYTKALLSVIPVPNPRLRRERIILKGDPPNPIDLPGGCRFHPRCPIAEKCCNEQDPKLEPVTAHRQAACFLVTSKYE